MLTLIAVLPERDFGSLREANLVQLRKQLVVLTEHIDDTYLIIDLCAVKRLGAGFLRCLVEAASVLRSRGRRLIVCNDRWDVAHCSGLDRLFLVLKDREAAIEYVARQVLESGTAPETC